MRPFVMSPPAAALILAVGAQGACVDLTAEDVPRKAVVDNSPHQCGGLVSVGACPITGSKKSGLYCGEHVELGAEPGTLYKCDTHSGGLFVDRICQFGCEVRESGEHDRCRTASGRQVVEEQLQRQPSFLVGLGDEPHEDALVATGLALDVEDHILDLTGEQAAVMASLEQILDTASAQERTLMLTLSGLTIDKLDQPTTMIRYWANADFAFGELCQSSRPVLIQLETELWAQAEARSFDVDDTVVTHLHNDCAVMLYPNIRGVGRCLLHLAHTRAPSAVVGFHVSSGRGSSLESSQAFMEEIGAADADVLIVEVSDRDAGCYEQNEENCKGGKQPLYWSATDYDEYLDWVRGMSSALGRPVLWWQVPLGVPSSTPGGEPGKYRDNRVEYFFSNVDKLIDAGGIGAIFRSGDSTQTSIRTDGGQFETNVADYLKSPSPL